MASAKPASTQKLCKLYQNKGKRSQIIFPAFLLSYKLKDYKTCKPTLRGQIAPPAK